jgi:hypothetical protein
VDLYRWRGVRVGLGVVLSAALAASMFGAFFATSPFAREPETFLFSVQAPSGLTATIGPVSQDIETFILTLDSVDAVTMFSDRPFRNSGMIYAQTLVNNWSNWFADDPPNAVLTFVNSNGEPASMVMTLSSPRYTSQRLEFTAVRERLNSDGMKSAPRWKMIMTPPTFKNASLFIDGSSDFDVSDVEEFDFAPTNES